MAEDNDSSVILADAETVIKLPREQSSLTRSSLVILGPGQSVITINTVFNVIPMARSIISVSESFRDYSHARQHKLGGLRSSRDQAECCRRQCLGSSVLDSEFHQIPGSMGCIMFKA